MAMYHTCPSSTSVQIPPPTTEHSPEVRQYLLEFQGPPPCHQQRHQSSRKFPRLPILSNSTVLDPRRAPVPVHRVEETLGPLGELFSLGRMLPLSGHSL